MHLSTGRLRRNPPRLSWNEEAVKRILKVARLSDECVKYVKMESDALANQIFLALLKSSSEKEGPVKLSEIAETVYGASDKAKQDVIRLTMEKTLLKCGLADKIYFKERDVRYFPTAYRFQEVRRVETATGKKIDEVIGEVIELPRSHWPVPKEFFDLTATKVGYEDALKKLEEDHQNSLVTPSSYARLKGKLQDDIERVSKTLKKYDEITELMTK